MRHFSWLYWFDNKRYDFVSQMNKVSLLICQWCSCSVVFFFFKLETCCVLKPFAANEQVLFCRVASLSAQKPVNDSNNTSLIMLLSMSPRSLISLVLLGLTVLLSGSFYLWVLRYVCAGSCKPVAVDCESETLAGIVWSPVKFIKK